MNQKGHFVVIEGTDGSGKTTQIQLLADKLDQTGVLYQVIDFPRYGENEYANLVSRYLKGEFGGVNDVSPYLASLPYAGDRLLAKPLIESWLEQGQLVIANRYVPSNKAHMAAKLQIDERQLFIDWIDNLEHNINGIPREELVILLYVPPEINQSNVDKKTERSYLEGKQRDIHEADLDYLSSSSQIYLQLAGQEPHWQVINCMKDGVLRIPKDIHQDILQLLISRKILKKKV